MISLIVEPDEAGRVDRLVAKRFPEAARRDLADLFAAGEVRIAGRVARKGDRVEPGAEVTLARAPAGGDDLRVVPDADIAARLGIVEVTEDVIVVCKPPGIPSQPLRAGERGTAANGIVELYPECAAVSDDPRDGGLVHRLDIGTSGALIAARTRAAWVRLRSAFGAGEVDKEYLALTEAPPAMRECDLSLRQRGRRVVVDLVDGQAAYTRWEEVSRHGERRLLRCFATTGRMHQIRAHLAQASAPIVGDDLYGGQPFPGLVGFFLHAAVVRFDGRTVEAPFTADRVAVLAALGD